MILFTEGWRIFLLNAGFVEKLTPSNTYSFNSLEWIHSPLRLRSYFISGASMMDCWNSFFMPLLDQQNSKEFAVMVVFFFWNIYKSRNAFVFRNQTSTFQQVVDSAMSHFENFNSALFLILLHDIPPPIQNWIPPREDIILMIDTAFDSELDSSARKCY